MFHIPYAYMIHQCIYTLHTLMHAFIKVWTQNFMEMHQGPTLNNFKTLIKWKKKTLLFSTWNYLRNSNFNIHFLSFSKLIQMLQMKTWLWSLFNNLFMKIFASHCYTLLLTINYYFFLYFHIFKSMSNLIQINIHFMDMKRHMLIFNIYSCWCIGKKTETVIKWR